MIDNVPVKEGVWRNIFEVSPMTNNDERVHYTKRELDWSEFTDKPFKLVISRPVFAVEIEGGLKLERGSLFDEPEATKIIDGIWRAKTTFDEYINVRKMSVQKAIEHCIAYQYYDCMSGGMNRYVISVVRWLCEEFEVDGGVELYPDSEDDGKGYYDLNDFLRDTDHIPDIRDVVAANTVAKHLLKYEPAS